MAGQRRGTGRPTQAQRRAERRRALLTTRLAQATTPAQQLAAAADHARAVLAELPDELARPLADELTRHLLQATSRK